MRTILMRVFGVGCCQLARLGFGLAPNGVMVAVRQEVAYV